MDSPSGHRSVDTHTLRGSFGSVVPTFFPVQNFAQIVKKEDGFHGDIGKTTQHKSMQKRHNLRLTNRIIGTNKQANYAECRDITILKEINSEYSVTGLMLKLKLQY